MLCANRFRGITLGLVAHDAMAPRDGSASEYETHGDPIMTHFMNNTLSDLRSGRQSWRVVLLVCTPAFTIGIALALLQRGV
jgi:hypothetical protein